MQPNHSNLLLDADEDSGDSMGVQLDNTGTSIANSASSSNEEQNEEQPPPQPLQPTNIPEPVATEVLTAEVRYVEPEVLIGRCEDDGNNNHSYANNNNNNDDDDMLVLPPPLLHSPSSMTFGVFPPPEEEEKKKGAALFSTMSKYPVPFMVVLPIVFLILLILGWSTDSKIEEEVNRLWIAEGGAYAQDMAYAASLGMDNFGATSFAAMALSRDGKNILTADRLEEIRARMEATENIKLEYQGNTFTWEDICAQNIDPYRLPCLRLSAMDLYQEARWTFDDQQRLVYYEDLIREELISPLLPRFGILQDSCSKQCATLIAFRTAPETLGYPPESKNSFALLADIQTLEYSDPCKICIEDEYIATIKELHDSILTSFGYLQQAVNATRDALSTDAPRKNQLKDISDKLGTLIATITSDDVVEFYSYYVARGLYANFGVDAYLRNYEIAAEAIQACYSVGGFFYLTCPLPLENMTADLARQALLNHADNVFSSVTTAGLPFPLWSEPDGTGVLFKANNVTGMLMPVSGSGVNMSAPVDSMRTYFQYLFLKAENIVDPNSREWEDLIEANPMYAWFMASLTPADPGMKCGNGNLTGTDTGAEDLDVQSAELLGDFTPRWCGKFDVPGIADEGTGDYTKQYFAKMWYDLLFTSEALLDFKKGEDDPYSWTIGTGCDYSLKGQRFSYSNQSDGSVLYNSSRLLYNIDEGTSFGVVDPSLLIGGANPAVGKYSYENPLKEVTVLQTLYAALIPSFIQQRVANCKRPGGPVEITEDEAKTVLKLWKEAMENAWNEGWDDENDGEVQFVSFFDDAGDAIGSTGRMLNAITLDNNTLMAVSIIIIAVFSALFLFSRDMIESRVLVTLVGVGLVVLSFFAAVGFSLLLGIKINVNVAWTLPFVIIGLGVDDVYIVLIAIKKQGGYTKSHWLKAMREVIVPVTMTSLTNASMFAIMNISDIPAVYLTSQVACYCIIFLYLSVIFCFPAFCYLDLKRQHAGRMDVLVCLKSSNPPISYGRKQDVRSTLLYDRFYKPVVLNSSAAVRKIVHGCIFVVSFVLFGVAAWGISQREVGLGLEDFFPSNNPSYQWATVRTAELSSWPININWGALDYANPDVQMRIIKQFEDVVTSDFVSLTDTKNMWMADLAVWTTRHCTNNFARPEFDRFLCGRDQIYPGDNSTCSGSWVPNKYGLREKIFSAVEDETCRVYEAGVCRPRDRMHTDDLAELDSDSNEAVFCPVISGWSDDKWQFCMGQWRNLTNADFPFVFEDTEATPTECSGTYYKDERLQWPIPYSRGPLMFSKNLNSHQTTLDMMEQTRSVCDSDPELRCWVSGIPFDYWSQYDGIDVFLVELAGYATLAGFAIATVFLSGKLTFENYHSRRQIFIGSLAGAALIAVTMVMTLVTVVGFSILGGVSLTGFSNMAFILSVGFAVEYSVHIVSRWMRATMSLKTSLDRVHHTMSFLMLPTFMSFISSTIGVACLAFTDFDFNKQFFFRPLMIVMIMSYWFGCWFLPVLLIYVDFDFVKLGKPAITVGESRRATLTPVPEIETKPQEMPIRPMPQPAPPTTNSSDMSQPSSVPQHASGESSPTVSDSGWDIDRHASQVSRPDPPEVVG